MTTKKNPKSPAKTPGAFIAVAPAAANKPTPNQILNFVINTVAYCSGYSASVITKDWVLGNPVTDESGDKHPGAGLGQGGIDGCVNPNLNQLIVHFGGTKTVAAGTYGATTKLSEIQKDVGGRIP
jgi:hypothetical protein